jgi:hypothetical protein
MLWDWGIFILAGGYLNVSKEYNNDDLLKKINILIDDVSKLNGQIISSGQLNQLLDANVFLQILNHIKRNIFFYFI